MNELADGLFLMAVGMGTVFLFLCLLIITTELLRVFCGGAAPLKPAAPDAGAASAQMDQARLTAVITAAINHHLKHRK